MEAKSSHSGDIAADSPAVAVAVVVVDGAGDAGEASRRGVAAVGRRDEAAAAAAGTTRPAGAYN